jgi:pimeloyl-ACP methyl ester carboxylesterase
MDETLRLRLYGDASRPTLIYLPGLHGDWTLIAAFRKAVAGHVRFVEMTYPRTLTWSLDDYAAAIEQALLQNGVTRGWLLAESFGSQPAWALVARNPEPGFSQQDSAPFQIDGLILAGGFVRHPLQRLVRWAERAAGAIPLRLLITVIFGYAKVARFRFRRSPEILERLDEFIERRTELDRQAAVHRLHLIAESDFRSVARGTNLPVFALTGLLDPIVPWPLVRRWLRHHCPALRDYQIIRRADHNVLGTGTQEAARLVLRWMKCET